MAREARSGPSPPVAGGSFPGSPGTSAPEVTTWQGVRRVPGPAPGMGGWKVPCPLSPPGPAHQPPVDEVGQAGAGPSAEIPPVRPADLPETAVSGGSGGDAGPRHPPVATPYGTLVCVPSLSPFGPSGKDSCSSLTGWAGARVGRQTDSPGHSGVDSRTEAAHRAPQPGWPHYLVPSPVSGDGGSSRVTVALELQLPEEPARLQGVRAQGARGRERPTQIGSERERGRREGQRWGEEMSLAPLQGTWSPQPLPARHPHPAAHAARARRPAGPGQRLWGAQHSPSNPACAPG